MSPSNDCRMLRVLTAAGCIGALVLALILSAIPQLHEELHAVRSQQFRIFGRLARASQETNEKCYLCSAHRLRWGAAFRADRDGLAAGRFHAGKQRRRSGASGRSPIAEGTRPDVATTGKS